MKTGQEKELPEVMNLQGPSRFSLSNPSARIALALLFVVSLNAVACYDTGLSAFLKITRLLRGCAAHGLVVALSLGREFCELLGRRLH
jgi:hypothetical protein